MSTHGAHTHAGCHACNYPQGFSTAGDKPDAQIPLFRHPWSRHARLTWQQLAQTLPANLSLELTREHGWRIVPLPVETRRALDLLEVHEGDVNPDTVTREARRRRLEAQLLLEQAQDVLRAVQTDNDARMQRRRPVLIDYQEATG